jgi:uncharacterized membrane protein SpoIIM required for sporulation
VDLDAYVAEHAAQWRRLEQLTAKRRLTGPEADELMDCYQQVATHLSVVRSAASDASVVAYLSGILSRARTRSAGTSNASWRDVGRFFTETFPGALYRMAPWWLGTLAASVLVAVVMTWWLLEHPQVESQMMSPQQIDQLVNADFENYYSEHAASSFAAQVWTNNAWVAALCVSLGVLGVPVIYLLLTNLANLAVVASIMIRHDRGDLFFGLILPHGLLELTAVFVAGGVGLKLFWSWVEPGALSRSQSLARAGRAAFAVVLGLAAVLLVSGVIEAFVTPSGLPTWARIAIGVVAEALFLLYVFTLGRAAARRGVTGDVDAGQREDEVASVA